MAWLSDEVKAIRSNRLNQLVDEVGIRQVELAARIGRSAVLVSNMMRGKASVSDATCEALHAVFPDYSLGWLKGEEEFPNERIAALEELKRSKHDGDLLAIALDVLLEYHGCTLTTEPSAAPVPTGDDAPGAAAGGVAGAADNAADDAAAGGFRLGCDGRTVDLTSGEVRALEADIADYVGFKVHQLMRKAEEA